MFGKNLRYLRLNNNLSQEELARELGYKSFTTIQKWETGTNEPNMSILNKLADKWHVTLDELVNSDLEARRYAAELAENPNADIRLSPSFETGNGIWQQELIVPDREYLIEKKNSVSAASITVYGKVCAGDGIEAFEDPIDEITNPYHRIKKDLFALQVHGDSMNNVVNDRMYAIVEKKEEVNNGDIAVVLIDREMAMLKRFYRLDESTIVLKPDSSNTIHKAMMFENDDINRLKIIGRYIGHVSPMLDL